MAGRGKGPLAAIASPHTRNQRSRKRQKDNRRTIRELKELTDLYDVQSPLEIGTLPDVLDECLRRAVGDMRFAGAHVDALAAEDFWVDRIDAQGNRLVEPHPWIQLEKATRTEVVDIAARLAGLDLDERRVAIAEAQAALLQRALTYALNQIGLTKDQRAKLGPALREARGILEGTATDITTQDGRESLPIPVASTRSAQSTAPTGERAGKGRA